MGKYGKINENHLYWRYWGIETIRMRICWKKINITQSKKQSDSMDSGKSEPESMLCWFPNLGSYSQTGLRDFDLEDPCFSRHWERQLKPATFLGTQTDVFRGSPKKGVVSFNGETEITRGYGHLELGKRLPATVLYECCFNPITSHCNHIAII